MSRTRLLALIALLSLGGSWLIVQHWIRNRNTIYSTFGFLKDHGDLGWQMNQVSRPVVDAEMGARFETGDDAWIVERIDVAMGMFEAGNNKAFVSVYDDNDGLPGKELERHEVLGQLKIMEFVNEDHTIAITFDGITRLEPQQHYWIVVAEAPGGEISWLESPGGREGPILFRVNREEWRWTKSNMKEFAFKVAGHRAE